MHTSLFHLSDEPFIEPETVISVFMREDGEIFARCHGFQPEEILEIWLDAKIEERKAAKK